MPLEVSSWFVEQADLLVSEPKRVFTIGNSDYTAYVLRWPSFSQKWDDIRPGNLTMRLSNNDQTFNFFINNKLNIVTSASVKVGFTHPTSGDELITMFTGMISEVLYDNGECSLTVTDQFKPLSERIMGTQDVPVDFTGSSYLPSDLAWYACTSYGGLSAIQSTSNPDIDYASFLEWANVFSGDSVFLSGRFTGQKCTAVLRKIARITQSAIFRRNNKVYFRRFSLVDSLSTVYDYDNSWDASIAIRDSSIINKQYVMFDYDVTSRYHKATVFQQTTHSVNSYGLREETEKDEQLWYVDSPSSINLAQRILIINDHPYNDIELNTGIKGFINVIGDMLQISEPQLSISNDTYRVMESRYNLDNFTAKFGVNASQLSGAIILDTSTLGSTDILS